TGNRSINVANLVLTTVFSGNIGEDVVGRSLTKLGAGTLSLSGMNTFSGGVTVNNGKLVVASNSAVGTGALTINGGAVDLGTFSAGVSMVNLLAGSVSMTGDLATGPGGLLGPNLNLAAGQTVTVSGTTTIDQMSMASIAGGTLNTGALVGTGMFSFIS